MHRRPLRRSNQLPNRFINFRLVRKSPDTQPDRTKRDLFRYVHRRKCG